MIDRRFPYLVLAHDAPGIDASRRCALAEFAGQLLERVGCQALIDLRSFSLFVHLAHDITQGLALPPPLVQLRHRSGWDWSILDKLDELCRVIRSARISWHTRDWMDGYREKARVAAEYAATRKEVDGMSDEIKSMYEHCKAHHGMGRHFKRGLVVSGFKGR